MKKIFVIVLSVVLLIGAMAGCGTKSQTSNIDLSGSPEEIAASIKTVGDALSLGEDYFSQSATVEYEYIYVMNINDTYFRFHAPLDEETFNKIIDLDILEEGYEDKLNKIISPLEIGSYENLSKDIPTSEELDKLIGKTGKELVDDGWTFNGYMLDAMEFYMNKNPYAFVVVFDGEIKDYDNFSEEQVYDKTVKSVTFDGLGDATEIS